MARPTDTPELRRAREQRNKAIADQVKQNRPCKFCGRVNNSPGLYLKPESVGRGSDWKFYKRWGVKKLQQEISIREVFCHECHSKWKAMEAKRIAAEEKARVDAAIENLLQLPSIEPSSSAITISPTKYKPSPKGVEKVRRGSLPVSRDLNTALRAVERSLENLE